jgi:hypothetical protein
VNFSYGYGQELETRPCTAESSSASNATRALPTAAASHQTGTPGLQTPEQTFGVSSFPGFPVHPTPSPFSTGKLPSEMQIDENMFKETAGHLGSLAKTPEGANLAGLEISLTPPDPLRPFHLGKSPSAKLGIGKVLYKELASVYYKILDGFTASFPRKPRRVPRTV